MNIPIPILNFYILDALIEAIESGTSSIDYMDDVGQTLLNWASAFGTQVKVLVILRQCV